MKNPKWEEIILAAPRMFVFEEEQLAFQGVNKNPEKVAHIMKNIENNVFPIRRGNDKDSTPASDNAEINLSLLQPIPYVVIRRRNELFLYERLEGGGEGRLHNKLSLGAGGHMNPETGIFSEELKINLERELEEELNIEDKNPKISYVGLINDDSDDLNRVHIGVLVMIDVAEGTDVTVRETDQLRGSWAKLPTLKNKEIFNRLEAWSQIVVDVL